MEEAAPVIENVVAAEQPAATEGRAKRERKQTEVFVVEAAPKEAKDISVPAGQGCTLGSVSAFEEAVTKVKGDDEVLKSLHSLCFGVQGTKLNRKKNMRQFCGFSPDTDKMAIENKLSENKKKWNVSLLKESCALLSLERSGSREELIKRVVDYLACPSEKAAVRAPRKAKGTKRKRTTKASKSNGEPKSKRAPSAFILFSSANRELAKSENPGASFTDIGKVLGAMWNGLSDAEKQTWRDAAAGGAAAGGDTESSEGEEEDDAEETNDAAEAVEEENGTTAATAEDTA